MTNTATQTRPQSRSTETARRARRSTSRAAAEKSEAAAAEQPATTRPAGRRTASTRAASTRTTAGRTATKEATTAVKAAAKTEPAAPRQAGQAEPSAAERAAERAAGKAVAGAESVLAQAKWTARTLAAAVPLPEPRRLLYYGGIGALAALGILEWPVAAVAAAGVWIATHTDGHEEAARRAAGPPGAEMKGAQGVPATAR
ncbi:hypothetical protein GCM10010399_28370 [Dactylosporangium fulvum]|uniref:Uncharacterized protein n=1 Tax=Dactylosporangium fulvum TaxID=53359 RepID=A0ABY5W8B6_9ACTN|nr:hypothetical protein [Dactylosporangium fulvum]UWP86290.1 hypothetical protein Dfulv_19430 [Dactylosporangium fulvum]